MAKFRRRVTEIEAVQWLPSLNLEDLPEWFRKAVGARELMARDDGRLIVCTLEGDLAAQPGDWVVKGIRGELYPVKDSIFRDLYEAASGEAPAASGEAPAA